MKPITAWILCTQSSPCLEAAYSAQPHPDDCPGGAKFQHVSNLPTGELIFRYEEDAHRVARALRPGYVPYPVRLEIMP